jgi:medium-chain acyl-[acyl-carrier-protein] hydrolase
MTTTPWLMSPPAPVSAAATWQLFCFPHAGAGTAMYSPWVRDLAPGTALTAICPPGRERHLLVAPHRSMAPLVEQIVAVLEPIVRAPFAFFGHSVGALVAFEVARELWQRGCGPAHLFASASRAPHEPGAGAGALYRLTDEALIEELVRQGGMSAELATEADLVSLVLPPLRADLGIAAHYVAAPGPPLPCGITALGGIADDGVAATELLGWRQHTAGAFARRLLPGDHFYLTQQWPLVLDAIRRDLPAHPTDTGQKAKVHR